MRRPVAALVAAFMLCCATTAMALGFGAVTNATRLGQPLDFTVAVKLDPDEAVEPACVNADVTAGDTHIPPAQVRARLVRSSRATDAFVRIGTTSRVREPVVTVLLSLGCPPRASHKFVSLLDPPLPAALRGDATRAMPGGAPARASATTPATAPAAMTPSPAPVVVAAADAATPAPAPPDGDDRSRDREQLQALEQRVEVLRQDQQAAQQSVAALQSKLRQMEEGRHDPALYGLAKLVVLLLGVIALLLWRQSRVRSEDAWLSDSQALADGGARHSEAQRMSAVSPSFDEVTMTSMRVVPESTYPNPATEPPIPPGPETAAPAPQGPGPRTRRDSQ